MSTLTHTAELHRLLDGDSLSRPLYPLASDGTAGRRDPSPTWDAWYCLSLERRRRLVRYMAPAGSGLTLDDMAMMIGADSLEEALEVWAQAVDMARGQGWEDDWTEWQEASEQAEADGELYGPAELASRLGISVANLHQRRHRGLLPAPDLTLSRVPIWSGETIRIWEQAQCVA